MNHKIHRKTQIRSKNFFLLIIASKTHEWIYEKQKKIELTNFSCLNYYKTPKIVTSLINFVIKCRRLSSKCLLPNLHVSIYLKPIENRSLYLRFVLVIRQTFIFTISMSFDGCNCDFLSEIFVYQKAKKGIMDEMEKPNGLRLSYSCIMVVKKSTVYS